MRDSPITLLHIFNSFSIGGAQCRFTDIANATIGQYRHIIIALDGDTSASKRLDPSTGFELFPLDDLKSQPFTSRCKAISHTLRHITPDILMTYNWGTIEWVTVNRFQRLCENIHWEDGFGPEEAEQTFFRRNLYRKLFLKGISQTLVPSRKLERIASQKWGVPKHKLTIFPNGVQLPPASSITPSLNRLPVFSTLATLRPEKNIHRLIATFLKCVDTGTLIIGGDGPMLEPLRDTVTEMGAQDRVTFPGRITDIPAFLSQADVFCLSSDTEQAPMSVLEAMAMKLPVISTDVGDVRLMLSGPNQQYIAPAKDYESAFRQMINDRNRWEVIGEANRQKVAKEHSFETMTATFNRLVRNATSG